MKVKKTKKGWENLWSLRKLMKVKKTYESEDNLWKWRNLLRWRKLMNVKKSNEGRENLGVRNKNKKGLFADIAQIGGWVVLANSKKNYKIYFWH